MKRILFALVLTLTAAVSANANPTTQELINCARNRASVEPLMADLKMVGQSLDLIETGTPARKNFIVLFDAEARGGTTYKGSVEMIVGRNVDEEATSCIWKKDGTVFRASVFNFRLNLK